MVAEDYNITNRPQKSIIEDFLQSLQPSEMKLYTGCIGKLKAATRLNIINGPSQDSDHVILNIRMSTIYIDI